MSKRKQDVQGSARETSFVGDGSLTVAAMDQNRRATAAQMANRKIRQAKGHRRPGTPLSSPLFTEASSATGASDQQNLQTSALPTPAFSFAQPPPAQDSPFSFSGGSPNVPHNNSAAAPPQPSSGSQSFHFTPPATGFSFSTPAPTNNPFNAANGSFASSAFNSVNPGFNGSIFSFPPSTALEPSRPAEQSTSATPFGFGSSAPPDAASSIKPFGFNSTSASEAPTSSKPFSFSTTSTAETSSSSKPFGFSSPSTSQPPPVGSLTFGLGGKTQPLTTSSSLNFNTPALSQPPTTSSSLSFPQPPTTSNLFNFNSPSASQPPTSTSLFSFNRPSTSQAPSSLASFGSSPGTSQAPSTSGTLGLKLPSTSQPSSSSDLFGSKPLSTLESSSTSGLFGLNTQGASQPSSSPGPFKLDQSTSNPFNQVRQEPASAHNPFSSLPVTPPVITSAPPTASAAQTSSEPSHLKATPLAQGGIDADPDTAMSSESPELSPQKGQAADNALTNTPVDSVREEATTPAGAAVEVNDIAGSETPQTQFTPTATATDTDSYDDDAQTPRTATAPASADSFQPASPSVDSPQPSDMSSNTVNGRTSPSPTAAKMPWDGIGVSDFPFDVEAFEPRGPDGFPPSPAPPPGHEVPPERQWKWDEGCRIAWLDDFIKDAIPREDTCSPNIAWLCRYYLEKRAHIDMVARKAEAAANKRKSGESHTDGESGRQAKRHHADDGDAQPAEDDEASDNESVDVQDLDGRYVLTDDANFELVPRSPSPEPATNGQHAGRDLKRKAEEQPDSGDGLAPSTAKKSRLETARPQRASPAANSVSGPSSQSASIFQNIIGETTNATNGTSFQSAIAAATAAAAAAAMPAPPKFGAASLAQAASSPNGTGPEGDVDADDDKPDNDGNDEPPSVFTRASRFAPGQIAPYNIFGHLAQANHDGVDGGGDDDNEQQG